MLYWLYQTTQINIFQYITVRSGIAFFISLILSMYLMPKFIKWATNKKANQPIYSLAPQSHQLKGKTPTMGGLIIVFSALIAILFCVNLTNIFALIGFGVIALFGLIGIKDDISKVVGKNNTAGLKPKSKMLMQILAASMIAYFLYSNTILNTQLYLPFYKHPVLNLGWFSVIFWILVMVSSSNAVNLTDGLDGLATVPSILSMLSLGVFVYISGHAILSGYLLLPKISGIGEVVIIAASLIGSLVGFLWYNCYPADVFMGDSGSLSLGAFIGYMAIISKNEILLLLIGFVFVLETLSVILQVGSFKTRKKRVFLMAPIHHHFEIKGWAENKIIVRFWIMALISNIIALTALKIR
ncbi:MAG: phospho-N-acetylmuramoyl-pentapeptide-transferase [Campylobacteraceae bacterium]|nr:phospho-N-acetylmuramoyl-pentapeptide-transferase [Campylobacteraceae bacterium]